MIIKEKVWVIMSKDRNLIAKGIPRDRKLIRVYDKEDKSRYLTYSTKRKAESGFKSCGFYNMNLIEGWERGKKLSDFLEAVECEITFDLK